MGNSVFGRWKHRAENMMAAGEYKTRCQKIRRRRNSVFGYSSAKCCKRESPKVFGYGIAELKAER